MSTHNHTHSCSCAHTSVKFCKKCNLVHCLGCNQEWVVRSAWTWHYPYYSPYTYPYQTTISCGTPQNSTYAINFGEPLTNNLLNDVPEVTNQAGNLNICEHKD